MILQRRIKQVFLNMKVAFQSVNIGRDLPACSPVGLKDRCVLILPGVFPIIQGK